MASIARKNLFEDIPRFLVAQAGIVFAVSLVTIQVGILRGFTRGTALLIDQSKADIWVGSADMVQMELTSPLPLEQLLQARKVPGVALAEALVVSSSRWRTPDKTVPPTKRITPVRIFGFNPKGQLFAPEPITQGSLSALTEPYTVIVDESNQQSLNLKQLGAVGTIASLKAKLVGTTQGTQSIASSTYIFTSLESAKAYAQSGISPEVNCRLQDGNIRCNSNYDITSTAIGVDNLTPPVPEKLSATDPISYILVKATPNQNLKTLKQALEKALPGTRAFTRLEMAQQTRDFWQKRTGVGFVLGLGATVGVIVGMVIVSQILYSSVSDHLKEFGTLKAMGASDWVIYGVILEQALWMAVLGYIPGILLCLGLGSWTLATQGIIILITPLTAGGVLLVTVSMCIGSALFAIQKVTHVDPAIVFKA
ncbi:MAG: ABC transporter permease [Scytolyngbya sp. HA4215-MV1]|jgi:putative ABC transport system permease protein|nr:ABC transporter permease [Scytolyngbya sp. HA4215-MV1]